jgi:hypothetical protein
MSCQLPPPAWVHRCQGRLAMCEMPAPVPVWTAIVHVAAAPQETVCGKYLGRTADKRDTPLCCCTSTWVLYSVLVVKLLTNPHLQ